MKSLVYHPGRRARDPVEDLVPHVAGTAAVDVRAGLAGAVA